MPRDDSIVDQLNYSEDEKSVRSKSKALLCHFSIVSRSVLEQNSNKKKASIKLNVSSLPIQSPARKKEFDN